MTAQLATAVIMKTLRRGERPLYVYSNMGSPDTSELFENLVLGTLIPVKDTLTIIPASKASTRYSSGN